MNFRSWIETEIGLNGSFPEVLPPINRGISTPASAEVVRTGLQPQVGAEEIRTDAKDEQDKIQAVDAEIQRLDSRISQGESGDKINKFRDLWNELKDKWEQIKVEENPDPNQIPASGFETQGHQEYIQAMRKSPNAVLTGPNQSPIGPNSQ
jgi:hypothetical protein